MGALLQNPTQAEQDFLARFALEPVDGERQAAAERFARAGLPSRRNEAWHYTDLRAKLRAAPPLAARPDAAALARAKQKLAPSDRLSIVTVDGYFIRELSDDLSSTPGLSVRALKADEPALKSLSRGADDALLDLNAAFAQGGVAIEIAAGAQVEKILELVALDSASGALSRFAHHLVVLGEGAHASLVETRAEGAEGFGDSALFVSLGRGAQLDYACRSLEGGAVEVQNFVARLGSEAQLRAVSLLAGAPFLRRQYFVSCDGANGQIHLSGATLLRGREHADVTLTLDHDAPACLSRETFKYVLADQADGVFQGKIVVPPHAQKTDGKMLCRALLLSDDAAMSSKPELEIFADDVACGHGAACAKLDASQLFYMESRGIPRAESQAILVEAFAAEAFDDLKDERLRDLLSADLALLLADGAFT
ncbi:SufD family Fe-S cluster assembly protein [Rhodoblastus sp.]|jgi:Fe-S cluster assembly protein SufD|uniref:SufB/SufD family protein n=1 Tax=Rhodoblastus sp. TaxID=1962975 RepID=UPI0025ECAC4C|nr:SufD family Fe-S cluster assembly protein [Rhodoblastus sp.]